MAIAAGVLLAATACTLETEDLGGEFSRAKAINNNGVLIGDAEPFDGVPGVRSQHGYKRFPDGTVVDLGSWPGSETSWAEDINDAGFVVGFTTGVGTEPGRAVRWDPSGQITDVGLPGVASRAYGINEAGVIVGDARVGGQNVAIVFDPAVGHAVQLPSAPGLSGYTGAHRINDLGQVLGSIGQTSVLWDLTTGTVTDLEQLTGLQDVRDITNSGALLGGDATGIAIVPPGTNSPVHIFDGSGAIDMNEDLTVVGRVFDVGTVRAFRWSPESGFGWINSPAPWTEATAVNDHDQIVGEAGPNTWETHTVFLFP